MKKIVIVDDEIHIRIFLTKILVNAGFEVIGEASNGLEALEICTLSTPDILLLDLNMPVLSGDELLLEFKKQFPNTFIIMISSMNNIKMIDKCLDSGADGFIRKDTEIDDMINILNNIISNKEVKVA